VVSVFKIFDVKWPLSRVGDVSPILGCRAPPYYEFYGEDLSWKIYGEIEWCGIFESMVVVLVDPNLGLWAIL
jgi:hypothetical protein